MPVPVSSSTGKLPDNFPYLSKINTRAGKNTDIFIVVGSDDNITSGDLECHLDKRPCSHDG